MSLKRWLRTKRWERRIKAGTPSDDERLLRIVAGILHDENCGWNCPGHGVMQEVQDENYRRQAATVMLAIRRFYERK